MIEKDVLQKRPPVLKYKWKYKHELTQTARCFTIAAPADCMFISAAAEDEDVN